MADYLKSFQAGLEAHNDAERARKEIADVFREFAKAVHDASDGHVAVELPKAREIMATRAIESAMHRVQDALVPDPLGSKPEESFVLVAKGRTGQEQALLSEYTLGERGYPVTLRYGRTNVRCYDREGLEQELQKLLEHPDTGGKLRRLMTEDGASQSGTAPPS
jgi:hypothetical protein